MKMLLAATFFIVPLYSTYTIASELDKKVTVLGQCTVEASPDRGSITFVVTHLEADAKNAISKSTSQHEKLRDELKRSRVKDLELASTEYQVQERKEWENNRSVSKGFEARIGLRAITPDLSALGELISIAAKIGVRETHSLNTYLSEEKTLSEKKKCLESAARNAREKAETLAKSLGAKVGRVLTIQETGIAPPPPPVPVLERGMMKAMDTGGGPTLEGQSQTIRHSVEVTFALE